MQSNYIETLWLPAKTLFCPTKIRFNSLSPGSVSKNRESFVSLKKEMRSQMLSNPSIPMASPTGFEPVLPA
jgi:hypothetical protein